MQQQIKDSTQIIITVIAIFLILFTSIAASKLPKSISKHLENPIIILIVFSLIGYLATKDFTIAIIAVIALIISYQNLSFHKLTNIMIKKTNKVINDNKLLNNNYNEETNDDNNKLNDYNEETNDYNEETNDYNNKLNDYNEETNNYNEETNDYNEETNEYNEETNDYNEETTNKCNREINDETNVLVLSIDNPNNKIANINSQISNINSKIANNNNQLLYKKVRFLDNVDIKEI